MKEECFSVILPLRVQHYGSILRTININGIYAGYEKDDQDGYVHKFDAKTKTGKLHLEYTKVGFVYACHDDKDDNDYFIILNTAGEISPIMDHSEIMEHFKFVEAENETEKV